MMRQLFNSWRCSPVGTQSDPEATSAARTHVFANLLLMMIVKCTAAMIKGPIPTMQNLALFYFLLILKVQLATL